MHHHTEKRIFSLLSSVFFCLLFSCLVSPHPSSLLSLSLSSLSVSVFLRVVLWSWCVVSWCVVLCVLVCDTLRNSVCPLNTSPCVRSKRPRVYRHHAHTCWNTCARGAGANGEVLNVHTVTFFIGKTSVLWHFLSVLNGCWVHFLSTVFCLPWMVHMGYHVLQRFTKGSPKKPLRVYTFKVWE